MKTPLVVVPCLNTLALSCPHADNLLLLVPGWYLISMQLSKHFIITAHGMES